MMDKQTERLADIYYFNPTCDFAIANGSPNWQPNQLLQKMEEDLDMIVAYLAKNNDILVLHKKPTDHFINQFSQLHQYFPEIILKNSLGKEPFIGNSINSLQPWGWSPAAHKLLSPLKPLCSVWFKNSPVFNWQSGLKAFYSRMFSSEILQEMIRKPGNKPLLPNDYLPLICKSQKEVEAAIEKWNHLMLKAPWSSSGRGLQPITKIPVHQKVWERINGIIKEQGAVIAEPFLNKVHDLAFLFELSKGKARFSGISHFFTDRKGQYQGNYLNGLPSEGFEEVTSLLESMGDEIRENLEELIEKSKLPEFYEGRLGVDMLIYRDNENHLRINPCLEINLRFTMGFVALELEKLIENGMKGVFRTYYDSKNTFATFSTQMQAQYPLKIINNKILSGYLPLNEPTENTLFGAFLLIE